MMRHAAYSQEGTFDSDHFLHAQCGKRAFSDAGAVECAWLIHNDLAIFQQAAARRDSYSPLFEGGVDLCGHG